MNKYERVTELARSYPDYSELADLIHSVCDAIYMYDDGFGDMPGKTGDLNNASLWVLRLVKNDLQYFAENPSDEADDKLKWFEQNKSVIAEIKDSL